MIHRTMPLTLGRDGAEPVPGAALPIMAELEHALVELPKDCPGLRLREIAGLPALLDNKGLIGEIAAQRLGAAARPVRALLFDKSERTNWALGWHQDRTIVVAERREVSGFGPWTVKHGMQHVAPPFALLASMLTLRIHLDPVSSNNAPLLIAPGSHRTLVAEQEIERTVAAHGTYSCLADAGDIWIYSTPILHASDAATKPTRRRVLQVDYAAAPLPGGLDWRGI